MLTFFKSIHLNPAILLACVMFGATLGLGLYTFWYANGASYFSSDPRACINCHVMQEHFDGWQKSSHHAVATCIECHLPHDFVGKYVAKAENGFWHSLFFTMQNFDEPIRIHKKNSRILQANCLSCHQELVGDLLHHGAFDDESNSCVRCHRSVGHGAAK